MPSSLARRGVAVAALLLGATCPTIALSQAAPVPRAVVPAAEAPEALSAALAPLAAGERLIEAPGAAWLQLRFAGADLAGGTLTVTGEDGDAQTFDAAALEAWGGLTAIFNGQSVTVALNAPGASATIEALVIGLPAPSGAGAAALETMGGDLAPLLAPFVAVDVPRRPEGAEEAFPMPELQDFSIESICIDDDRAASVHPFSGRIMPIGCTGWLIEGGAVLTAGHCITAAAQTLEFNVPSSLANGTTVSPAVQHQYAIDQASIVDGFTGIGNDWAVLRVLPNTQTGLSAHAAQGGAFTVSDTADPATVTVVGYGVDGPPPNFGNPPPRNADNQTQQTHSGALVENVVNSPSNARLRYAVDTQGGNSGSPVVGVGFETIGIHTNGGCGPGGGSNSGTSFRNAALWAAIQDATAPGGGSDPSGWLLLLLGD